MTRVEFAVGQGYAGDGKPLADVETIRAAALAHVANTFGGENDELRHGSWKSANGSIVSEPSLHIVTYTDDLGKVAGEAEYLRSAFHQESVLVASEPANVEFITEPARQA